MTIDPGQQPTAAAPSTGDPRVDAATSGLADLGDLPVGEHLQRYDDMHSQLQDIFNDVDSPASGAE